MSARDRFDNPLDPSVGYARGRILQTGHDEFGKVARGRALVGARLAAGGRDAVLDLTGMSRGAGFGPEDAGLVASQVPFLGQVAGQAEPLALRHMGADPATHEAVIVNRATGANAAALGVLLARNDRVVSLVPVAGGTHVSVRRPAAVAGATLEEVLDPDGLERAIAAGPPPRLVVITPVSPSRHHLDVAAVRRALGLPRVPRTLAYVDDAHLATRLALGEPPTFALGPVDVGVCSTDTLVDGPRAGVLVARTPYVGALRWRAWELGLEAQAAQYLGVRNALRDFDGKRLAGVVQLGCALTEALAARQGGGRVYGTGVGASMGAEDLLALALDRAGRAFTEIVPVEASGLVALGLLGADGILTLDAVSGPGHRPALHLVMYPDGSRAGVGRVVAAVDRALDRLASVLDDLGAARALLLGDAPAGDGA